MLQSLHIQNYALIEHLDIDFEGGFSVITGETGAGKSILLGAIGLLLGQRADLRMIKVGAQRCNIEAQFDLSQYDFSDYFSAHDLDFNGKDCIIRRELTATGKSRAFINDTPTSLAELKELGERLIDIHSQHQNLLLNKENFQLQVLDALAQDTEERKQYAELYTAYRQAQEEYKREQELLEKGKSEQDYIAYQLQQLQESNLTEGEEEELEQELNTLEHAEEIKSTLYQSTTLFENEDSGLVARLRETQRMLDSISAVYTPAQEWASRIENCYIEVRDIAHEVSNGMEEAEFDPTRLSFVNERLSTLHALKQKFHVESVEELIQMESELEQQMSRIENSDERLKEMHKRIGELEKKLDKAAQQLSECRHNAAVQAEHEMTERLVPLGMPNVRFQVEIITDRDFSPTGRDRVTFLFSANKNVPLQPISQIASGGEIARLMLALKAMTSKVVKLPTIIFDEIDTGVSGHIAEKMADIMYEMGERQRRQVISITHLPQIAARGSQHYRVFKTDEGDTTTSHIVHLTREERIEELAHMLSGSKLTQAAIDNAQALLEQYN